MNPSYQFKILLIGDTNVGKSSLMQRFTRKLFTCDKERTIGLDMNIKTVRVDNKLIKLQIWDTSGQEKYLSLTKSYYNGAHGVLVVFDASTPNSFYTVEDWIHRACRTQNLPIVVVGNKIDKISHNPVEIHSFSVPHIMTSAKSGENVEQAFMLLVKKCITHYNKKLPISRSPFITIEEKPKNRCPSCFQ